jgi:hypothetical protein
LTENPYRRTVNIWVIITIAAVAMIFLPGLLGVDGMSGGYAISFVSFFGATIGVIVMLVYRGLSSRFDAIVDGMEVLAHWIYPAELWRIYSDAEYEESIAEVKPLYIITSAMCIVAGAIAFLWDPEPGIYVFGVMIAVIILMALAASLTRMHLHNENLRKPGEVIISRKAVLLNNRLFYWDYFGSKLESVEVRKNKEYSTLIFTTWAPTLQFGQSYTLRIPIPPGKETKALEIASTLNI